MYFWFENENDSEMPCSRLLDCLFSTFSLKVNVNFEFISNINLGVYGRKRKKVQLNWPLPDCITFLFSQLTFTFYSASTDATLSAYLLFSLNSFHPFHSILKYISFLYWAYSDPLHGRTQNGREEAPPSVKVKERWGEVGSF